VLAGLAMAVPELQAGTVTVNLGQSSQNFKLDGLGSPSLYGSYTIELGTCASGTCTLSGLYNSTSSFGDGSYSLVTDYPGSSLPEGASAGPNGSVNENEFYYSSLAPGTTISLDLSKTGGPTYAIPIFAGGSFVGGFGIGFDSSSCSGLVSTPCSQINVGLTDGSSISGPVSGSATFDSTSAVATPEPGTLGLLGSGLLGLAGMLKRRRYLS